jgi:hypothetical protein
MAARAARPVSARLKTASVCPINACRTATARASPETAAGSAIPHSAFRESVRAASRTAVGARALPTSATRRRTALPTAWTVGTHARRVPSVPRPACAAPVAGRKVTAGAPHPSARQPTHRRPAPPVSRLPTVLAGSPAAPGSSVSMEPPVQTSATSATTTAIVRPVSTAEAGSVVAIRRRNAALSFQTNRSACPPATAAAPPRAPAAAAAVPTVAQARSARRAPPTRLPSSIAPSSDTSFSEASASQAVWTPVQLIARRPLGWATMCAIPGLVTASPASRTATAPPGSARRSPRPSASLSPTATILTPSETFPFLLEVVSAAVPALRLATTASRARPARTRRPRVSVNHPARSRMAPTAAANRLSSATRRRASVRTVSTTTTASA